MTIANPIPYAEVSSRPPPDCHECGNSVGTAGYSNATDEIGGRVPNWPFLRVNAQGRHFCSNACCILWVCRNFIDGKQVY